MDIITEHAQNCTVKGGRLCSLCLVNGHQLCVKQNQNLLQLIAKMSVNQKRDQFEKVPF